jgi:hypothetical protein
LERVVEGADLGGVTVVDEPVEEGGIGDLKAGEVALAARVLGQLADQGLAEGLSRLDSEEIEDLAAGLLDLEAVEKVQRWHGGGGFRVAAMAPSIFAVRGDRVLLSREATNGVFAEGVRAQLGFTALDEPPFSGRKGRMLLAVVDGVVDENAIQVLVAKADSAPMTVVAKAHTDGAPILLKELSSHSILRKAPAGLLRRRVRGTGR